jgi:acetylornithine deacetylase/succinyl-diaminopimelate desuccinylase-like protein
MFRGKLALLGLCLLGLASAPQAQPPAFDWTRLNAEATEWLAGLLRINTTNPPGNELKAAQYLAGILHKEGISAEILESAPGRGMVIARLRSGAIPDPSRALLLVGHTDVVGVERSKWTVDPFGAVLKDGYLYGRGALDMKGMVIAQLAVFVALKRRGVPLTRDVIFLATGDEEGAGPTGVEFAVEKHWEKIAAAFAINEGGRVLVQGGKVHYVGVQASEKVPINVTITAHGTSGHSSVPRKDNPVVRLAAAVARIGSFEAPAKPTTIVRRYFEKLASIEDQEIAKWMRALDTEREPQAIRRLSEANPVWNAMFRTTVAPTIVQGGFRANVVPSEARATVNIRLLPGESVYMLIEEFKKLVNDPHIQFAVVPGGRKPSPPSVLDTELFAAFERAAAEVFPGAPVVPMMSTGATDSSHLRVRNVQCYGILPFPLTLEEEAGFHADDERIPVAAFHQGIEYLYRVVDPFVRAP